MRLRASERGDRQPTTTANSAQARAADDCIRHGDRPVARYCLGDQTQLRGDAVLADNEQTSLLPVPQVEQEWTEVTGSLSLVVEAVSQR